MVGEEEDNFVVEKMMSVAEVLDLIVESCDEMETLYYHCWEHSCFQCQ